MAGPLTLMLRTSLTSVIQLSIDLADNEFGWGDRDNDKARILSTSFASKDLTGAAYLFSSG